MLRVRVKPADVPLKLRAHYVTTHSANLTWDPPLQLNPIRYKVCTNKHNLVKLNKLKISCEDNKIFPIKRYPATLSLSKKALSLSV